MLSLVSSLRFPKRVTIELTNDCNRQCLECPRHKTSYPIGYMKPKLFQHIVDQLPMETVVVPFFRGESLKHPYFTEMLYRLQGFKEVQLASNGDLLNEKNQEAIRACCTFFSLSLHAYQLPQDSSYIHFLRELEGEVTTQVSILASLLKDKDRFINNWLRHVDRVRLYVQHSQQGFGDVVNPPVVDVNLPCQKPFEEMTVYWDGSVVLCNHDWDCWTPLGNLRMESLKQVWNGLGYEAVRDYNLEGQRCHIKSCRMCDAWRSYYLPRGILGELYERRT